jgi:hypothetical protein
MDVAGYSEPWKLYQTTRRHITEDTKEPTNLLRTLKKLKTPNVFHYTLINILINFLDIFFLMRMWKFKVQKLL